MGAQLGPLAGEPDLVGQVSTEGRPRVDPVLLALGEPGQLLATHRCLGVLEQRRRDGERGRRLVGRPVLIGYGHGQDLPDRLPGRGEPVHEGTRRGAEPTVGQ